MIRVLLSILSVCCVAAVLTEAAAMGWLWSKGRLSADALREVKDVLAGKPPRTDVAETETADRTQPASDEIMQKRVVRLFDLGRREDELLVLKNLVADQAKRVTAMQAELERKQQDFEKRLKTLQEQNDEQSIQQSRAVLQALQPAEAAETLMGLPLEQSLTVVRGMPEKVIARILKELSRGDDKKIERGRKLFEALTEGEPGKSLIESAGADLARPPAAP